MIVLHLKMLSIVAESVKRLQHTLPPPPPPPIPPFPPPWVRQVPCTNSNPYMHSVQYTDVKSSQCSYLGRVVDVAKDQDAIQDSRTVELSHVH